MDETHNEHWTPADKIKKTGFKTPQNKKEKNTKMLNKILKCQIQAEKNPWNGANFYEKIGAKQRLSRKSQKHMVTNTKHHWMPTAWLHAIWTENLRIKRNKLEKSKIK